MAVFVIFLAAFAATAPAAGAGLERLIAPASVCPHQTEPGAPIGVQGRAMRCMTNFARRGSGLDPVAAAPRLNRAAAHKARDILRCDDFSHEACGREFTYWMRRTGYLGGGDCWRAAENIAWGTGKFGSVRTIFRAWMYSGGHRENILGSYAQIGIGLRIGGLEGNRGAHVWVQEFGSHRC